jgi:hypothetical protein
MACPIIPRPKKATRICEVLLVMKGLSGLDLSDRIKVKQDGSQVSSGESWNIHVLKTS